MDSAEKAGPYIHHHVFINTAGRQGEDRSDCAACAYAAGRSSRDAEVERLRDALKSIAMNKCCDNCQEAALVAKNALVYRKWVDDPGGTTKQGAPESMSEYLALSDEEKMEIFRRGGEGKA